MSIRRTFAAVSLAATMLVAAAPTSSAVEDPATGADQPPAAERTFATYNGSTIDLADGWQGATTCTEVAVGDVRCYDSVEAELKDLADESLGHAAAAKGQGIEVPDAIDTRGFEAEPLRVPSADSIVGTERLGSSVGTQAINDCIFGYACVYDTTTWGGRMLKWSASGTKNLSTWDFRDKAGSGCNNRQLGGFRLDDWRTGLPDPSLYVGLDRCVNFAKVSYTYGGNWNNKADAVTL
ncbi:MULTISPECIES: peptidase inhibitor family I36 protein [Streptomyces]|uniref:Secreted protein n=1 Tax=Streptomyces rutgersensis TaxID=53451 RepID=A0ABX6RN26_9ACTN|nr:MULTISPECIES: peptidase inhibitor family I36 protein [Streptomyces]PJM81080.1 hypothetical protein CH313_23905 [Streptomyces sp. TSRI0384-2]QNE82108.1 hypothetical protein F0345_14085 [Streptomyces rutgersensis]RPK90246.1 hypothetical protein EES47_09205 [Streptomyces sp. ADI98-12]